jgi:cell division protein FtsZ
LNNKLKEIYGNATMKDAFAQADNVLAKAAKSIAEIITVSGNINVDFEDVRTVMKDSGVAVMGSAVMEGDNRARKAVEAALNSPLLNNTDIYGSKYILLSIVVGDEDNFKFEELEEITQYVQEQAGEDAEIIFGQAVDDSLGKAIGVTIIATGFADKPLSEQKKSYEVNSNKLINKKVKLEYDDSIDFFDRPEEEDLRTHYNEEKPKMQKENVVQKPIQQPPIPPIQQQPPIQKKPEKIVYSLDGDYQYIEESEEDKKKKKLEEQYLIRKQKIESLKTVHDLSNEELTEKKEIPAYLRKNVKLTELPHSSATNLSRLKLNEDNELLGGNRFLHDNVD